MLSISNNIIIKMLGLSRLTKQVIALIFDIILSIIALFLSFVIRLETFNLDLNINFLVLIFFCLFFIPFYISFGLYKYIFRYSGLNAILNIAFSTSLYSIIFFILIFFIQFNNVPRSIGILQPILFFIFICFFRVGIVVFDNLLKANINKKNIILYGAGNIGFYAVNLLNRHKIIGFIDDDYNKIGNKLNNYKIYSVKDANELVSKYNINQIIITISNLSFHDRKKIISNINNLNVEILFFPSPDQIVDKRIEFNKFERVNLLDLIDRKITWNLNEIRNFLANKIIVITGAGGSIGSELVMQIISHKPQQLILIENSEYNLYCVEKKINDLKINNFFEIDIIYSLTSINDMNQIKKIFENYKPEIVFHAAAYKHVPLAERNIISYIKNNVIGTNNLINISIKNNVKNFLFVSTDKAVRPTNIMGATKRISELYLLSKSKNLSLNDTTISIVRFGNVIGSTGSVIPLFKEQLENGGPITVTHPEVTRYFMSVREAVGLILETLLISKGGEVFVLDMGKPVKIVNLAKKLIKLYGYKEKVNTKEKGGIEIKYIGLRPGEKLYEELLIGNNPTETKNNNIFLEKEDNLNYDKVDEIMNNLNKYLENNDEKNIVNTLQEAIANFKFNKLN